MLMELKQVCMNLDPVVTQGLPEEVPLLVNSLSNSYNRLDYYYPRIPVGVAVPNTRFIDISVDNTGKVSFDRNEVIDFMEQYNYETAFVRSIYCSAKKRPFEGSIITSTEEEDIERTVQSLINQHIEIGRDHGSKIAVRERLDLDYCPTGHSHTDEVRYFIRDGEIVYRHPPESDIVGDLESCEMLFSYVEDQLDEGIEYPDDQCQLIADTFDDLSWSVDFVREAKTGTYYLTDMGLNGLYWNKSMDKWHNLSGHGLDEFSPMDNI